MKASEYITDLKDLMDEHGDLELVDSRSEPIGLPEFNHDEGDEPVFVCADEA